MDYICIVCGQQYYSAATITQVPCEKCGGIVLSEEARTIDLIATEGEE